MPGVFHVTYSNHLLLIHHDAVFPCAIQGEFLGCKHWLLKLGMFFYDTVMFPFMLFILNALVVVYREGDIL